MIIENIELNNIRSYKYARIHFSSGKNLLIGDIGSGKSTILMAIDFALFGFSNVDPEKLLRLGERRGNVNLEFSINGQKYRIKRTVKKDRDRFSQDISIDYGEYINRYSAEEAKTEILRILDLKEYKNPRTRSIIFRYAIYIPQEEMRRILDENDEVRLNIIRRATGIDEYRIIIQNGEEILKELEMRIKIYEARIQDINEIKDIINNLKNNLEILNAEKNRMGKEIENLRKEIGEYEIKINEHENKIKEMENEISKKEELKKQRDKSIKLIESLRDEIKKIEKDMDDLKSNLMNVPEPDKNLYNKINEKLNEIDKKLIEYNKRLNVIERKKGEIKEEDKMIKNLNDEINNDNKTAEDLNLSIKDIEDSIKKLISVEFENESDVEIEIEKLDNEIKNLLKIRSVHEITEKNYEVIIKQGYCPTCGRTIHGHEDEYLKKIDVERNEIKKIEEKIKSLEDQKKILRNVRALIRKRNEKKNELSEINKRLEKNKKKIEDLINKKMNIEKEIEDFDAVQNNINVINEEKERLKINRENLEKNIDLYNRNNEIKNKIEKLKISMDEKKKRKEELEEDVRNINQDLENYEEILKERNKIFGDLNSLKDKYRNLKDMENEKMHDLGRANGKIDSAMKELETRSNEYEEKKRISEKIELLKRVINWIDEFYIPSVENIEEIIMEKIRRTMNEKIQTYFSYLINDPTKSIEINENFSPDVKQDTYDIDSSSLSGGERSSISLAYRLSLNDILRESINSLREGIIILDEPTEGFSRDQINKFSDILDSMDLNQIIIVTHERELESIADRIIKVEKENNESKII